MRSAMSNRFRGEKNLRELIKLKTIYELHESIANLREDVANSIEGEVLEHSLPMTWVQTAGWVVALLVVLAIRSTS